MKNKYSLHIGLNIVDNQKYIGKYNKLNNAEVDANFYEIFAKSKGFNTNKLIGQEATSSALFNKTNNILKKMESGDLFFLSFSGHGTRVKDLNSDEEENDNYDEALVLYDRILIDDELKNLWSSFKHNTRIFFITDSCFNGNVSRLFDLYESNIKSKISSMVFRGVDIEETQKDINNNIDFYSKIKTIQNIQAVKKYSLIHLASCQNNQLASDGNVADGASYFTGELKSIFKEDKFKGNYKELYESLLSKMPPWQSPNWDNHNILETNNFELMTAFE